MEGLLGVEQRHQAERAELVLPARHLEGVACRTIRLRVCLERAGVRLQRPQRIGDVLTGEDHCGTILRAGLIERCVGGAVPIDERARVEECLGERSAYVPEAGIGTEQLARL